MPYDLDTGRPEPRESLRSAVLELMSRTATGDALDDREMRAALRALVVCTRKPTDDLWDRYHGSSPDTRGRIFAKYGY